MTMSGRCHSRREIRLREIDLEEVHSGLSVLDLGCGEGNQLQALVQRGCEAIGLDPCPQAVAHCRDRGLPVVQAHGESLPFADNTFDLVVSRVVLPYTDERRVIAEVARVLKPGGRVQLSAHGLGYHIHDALTSRCYKRVFYGLRSIVNGHVYRWTGRRIPGWLGDTLYQSRRAMRRYFRENGLRPLTAPPHECFCGLPVFLYFAAEKPVAEIAERRPYEIGVSNGSCRALSDPLLEPVT